MRQLGGHGVVGAGPSRQSFPLGGPQFTALGTAVRAPGAAGGQPGAFTGEVSGQDFAKLTHGGLRTRRARTRHLDRVAAR